MEPKRPKVGVRFRQGHVFNPAGFVIRVDGLCRLNLDGPDGGGEVEGQRPEGPGRLIGREPTFPSRTKTRRLLIQFNLLGAAIRDSPQPTARLI
jgi:hypothetical protein